MTTKFAVGDLVRLKMSEGADGRQAIVGIAARVTVVDGLVYVLYDGKAGSDYAWRPERLEHVPRMVTPHVFIAPCGCRINPAHSGYANPTAHPSIATACDEAYEGSEPMQHLDAALDTHREWLALHTVESEPRCPCGSDAILADAEDWPQPLCYDCWFKAGHRVEPEPTEGDTWTSPTCHCVLRCRESGWWYAKETRPSHSNAGFKHLNALRAERIAQLERPAGSLGDAHLPLKPCSACGVRLGDPYHAGHHNEVVGALHIDLDWRIAAARLWERAVDETWEQRMRQRYGHNWSGPSDPDEGGW